MRGRDLRLLVGIVILTLIAIWVNLPTNPGIHIELGPIRIHRDIKVHQGLDLRGGLRVLLEADVPEDQPLDEGAIAAAKAIIENRVNGLGVDEPLVQLQGGRRIIVELPSIEDAEQAIATISEMGLLEFIDTGNTFLPPETIVTTTLSEEALPSASERVFTTVMTGKDLKEAKIHPNERSGLDILFSFTEEGSKIFSDFTSRNVNKFLAVAVDKEVISCLTINAPIPEGGGAQISTQKRFTPAEARRVSIQLRYGALPVPMKVLESCPVGPTLGQDSVRKSTAAGIIGLMVVFLFMLAYYRLPGLMADLALIIYALLTFALFKLIPVTLTMPGITGFLLSTGMAVDANILIFERMKEELRWEQTLQAAIEAGFHRAWSSIRDSNLSTIIICIVLYWFGSNFGASIVKSFAITLFIGLLINMLIAVAVTHTFVRLIFDLAGDWLRDKKWLLGI